MRRFAIALVAGVAMSVGYSQIATAADMPVKAPVYKAEPVMVAYNWSGFYIGLNAGGTWGTSTATETLVPGGGGYNGIGNTWSSDPSGFVGGGQVGFNWQAPGSIWVFGAEADFGYFDFDGTAVSPLAVTQASGTQLDTGGSWYATVRGRLGAAFNNVLLYATGGAIFADVRGQITDPVFVTPIQPSARTGWQTGWTAGGGVEWGFGRWSLKVEYLYFDLGTENVYATHIVGGVPVDAGHAWDIDSRGHIVRAGVNFRF